MNSTKVGLICIIMMILLTQISLTVDFKRTNNQLQKLQDSTNLIINRTDTVLTILQN